MLSSFDRAGYDPPCPAKAVPSVFPDNPTLIVLQFIQLLKGIPYIILNLPQITPKDQKSLPPIKAK
jgi:hypothetical protein